MSIDYALAKRLCTKHKSALTRAKNKSPEAVLAAVDAFYGEFYANHLPLPDAWRRWEGAREDAESAIRRRDLL